MQPYLYACAKCGGKTTKAYARSHAGLCKSCYDNDTTATKREGVSRLPACVRRSGDDQPAQREVSPKA